MIFLTIIAGITVLNTPVVHDYAEYLLEAGANVCYDFFNYKFLRYFTPNSPCLYMPPYSCIHLTQHWIDITHVNGVSLTELINEILKLRLDDSIWGRVYEVKLALHRANIATHEANIRLCSQIVESCVLDAISQLPTKGVSVSFFVHPNNVLSSTVESFSSTGESFVTCVSGDNDSEIC